MPRTTISPITVYLVLAPGLPPGAPAATLCTTDLIAGRHEDVGEITVSRDGDDLTITFATTGPWVLTETHLHLATSSEQIPQRRGAPLPRKFAYGADHDAGASVYTYVVPAAWAPGTTLYIAAHAIVVRECTMWVHSDATGALCAVGGPGTAAAELDGVACESGPRERAHAPAWQADADPCDWDNSLDHALSFRVVNAICGDIVDFATSSPTPAHRRA